MTEVAFKRRFKRAVKSAIKCLDHPRGSYQITLLNNGPFHIEGVREKEIRKIRVVLDEIRHSDITAVTAQKLPRVCTKEIWCKRQSSQGFVVREIQ